MQKIIRLKKTLIALFILMISATSSAQLSSFKEGPLITDFGKNATVSTHTVSKSAKFKVAFDIGSPADAGEVNRKFDSLARFINMHVGAGVDKKNIQLALVVHGYPGQYVTSHNPPAQHNGPIVWLGYDTSRPYVRSPV